MNIFKNLKIQRGQIAELRFWTEAMRRGVVVSRPHEGARYDFIVDCGSRLWRVQVKSTSTKVQGGYHLTAFGHSRQYSAREVDFIAAYVTETKDWYIIPLRALKGARSIYLGPRSRLAHYRGAWHLLLNKRRGARIELQAATGRQESRTRTTDPGLLTKPVIGE